MTRLPVSSLWYQSDTACDPAVWTWWSVTFVKTMPKYPVYKLQNFTAIVAFVHCLVHRFCVFYMYFLMQLSCVFFTDIECHYFAPWQMFKVLWLACLSVHLSVYLSVCLSAHTSEKPHVQISPYFLHVTCGCGSVLLCFYCNMFCTYGFVIDIMFSHNGVNGPQSEMTCFVRFSRQWHQLDVRQRFCLCSSGGSTGGEVCRCWLHFVATCCFYMTAAN